MEYFHKSVIGQRFLSQTIPALTSQLKRIADSLEVSASMPHGKGAPPCELCHVCCRYNGGEYHPSCGDCLNNGYGGFRHKDAGAAPNPSALPVGDIV